MERLRESKLSSLPNAVGHTRAEPQREGRRVEPRVRPLCHVAPNRTRSKEFQDLSDDHFHPAQMESAERRNAF